MKVAYQIVPNGKAGVIVVLHHPVYGRVSAPFDHVPTNQEIGVAMAAQFQKLTVADIDFFGKDGNNSTLVQQIDGYFP